MEVKILPVPSLLLYVKAVVGRVCVCVCVCVCACVRARWVAQLVKPELDLGSGHDLMACGFKPHIGLCANSLEPVWDSVSPSAPSPLALHIYQKQIKIFFLFF